MENLDYEEEECLYMGTDYLSVKIYLIGIFATSIAVISIVFNSFFTLVFIYNSQLRHSPIFYFGIIAVIDIVMAFNYIALMAVPVYMDEYELIWLYHLFLSYFRPMMAESACAMFSSMLLIVLATTERLLRTFDSINCAKMRRILERNRPLVCTVLILAAAVYKICVYFELDYVEHPNCTDWAKYEIRSTPLAQQPAYNFWWIFVTRNALDRIIPFFILVAMNFLIIRTLKKEHIRQSGYGKETKKRAGKSLKDATRVTVSVVSMYLMSQSLQVFITFWEAIHRQSLENQLRDFYSYANDVMSIMMLLGSFFRFPVYCTTNAPIRESSFSMLRKVCTMCWGITKHKNVQCDHLYKEVITESIGEKRLITDQKNQTENPKSLVVLPDDEDSNDCHEWML